MGRAAIAMDRPHQLEGGFQMGGEPAVVEQRGDPFCPRAVALPVPPTPGSPSPVKSHDMA